MNRRDHRHLKPHSKEWFEVCAAIDPFKCAIIRATIDATGKTDVCSICGDNDSAVGLISPGPLLLFRLCADCQQIRAGMHDETFTPIENDEIVESA